jgi:Hypothetical glycosyl hydrolase family 15
MLAFASAGGLATAASPQQRQTGIGVVRYGFRIAHTATTSRYGYVIAGASDYASVRSFNGMGFVYKSAVDIDSTCRAGDMCTGGVSYNEAASNGWILKSASGAEVGCPSYAQNRLADVGSPGYQRAWLRNVTRFMETRHLHGLFMDNLLGNIELWSGGTFPAKYPDNAAWERAMTSFIRYVGPRLKERGIYVLANTFKYAAGDPRTEDGSIDIAWWKTVGPNVSGLMSEYWQQNPIDPTHVYTDKPGDWTGHWLGWERLVNVAQHMNRDFFGLQWGSSSNIELLRYGRASFLLQWNGRGGAYLFGSQDGNDPTASDWVADIGRPAGPARKIGNGWQRLYTRGVVVLNPNATASQVFTFGRSVRLPSGGTTRTVTLAPGSALILPAA